jgi:hypothetical protein
MLDTIEIQCIAGIHVVWHEDTIEWYFGNLTRQDPEDISPKGDFRSYLSVSDGCANIPEYVSPKGDIRSTIQT